MGVGSMPKNEGNREERRAKAQKDKEKAAYAKMFA